MPKREIATSFHQKQSSYVEYATSQRLAAKRLLQELQSDFVIEGDWIDIGAGPTPISQELLHPTIIPVDLAYTDQNGHVPPHALCADMEHLPFGEESLDGIIATSSLQWSNNPLRLIEEFYKILKPGGYLVLAVICNNSLSRLRALQTEYNIPAPTTFPSLDSIKQTLSKLSGTSLHFEQYINEETFGSPQEALKAISKIGATAHSGKRLSPKQIKAFVKEYGDAIASGVSYMQSYEFALIIFRRAL